MLSAVMDLAARQWCARAGVVSGDRKKAHHRAMAASIAAIVSCRRTGCVGVDDMAAARCAAYAAQCLAQHVVELAGHRAACQRHVGVSCIRSVLRTVWEGLSDRVSAPAVGTPVFHGASHEAFARPSMGARLSSLCGWQCGVVRMVEYNSGVFVTERRIRVLARCCRDRLSFALVLRRLGIVCGYFCLRSWLEPAMGRRGWRSNQEALAAIRRTVSRCHRAAFRGHHKVQVGCLVSVCRELAGLFARMGRLRRRVARYHQHGRCLAVCFVHCCVACWISVIGDAFWPRRT